MYGLFIILSLAILQFQDYCDILQPPVLYERPFRESKTSNLYKGYSEERTNLICGRFADIKLSSLANPNITYTFIIRVFKIASIMKSKNINLKYAAAL